MKSPFKYKRKLNKENNKEQRTRDREGGGDAQRSPLFCILKYCIIMTTCKRKKKRGTHIPRGKVQEKKNTLANEIQFNRRLPVEGKSIKRRDERASAKKKKTNY